MGELADRLGLADDGVADCLAPADDDGGVEPATSHTGWGRARRVGGGAARGGILVTCCATGRVLADGGANLADLRVLRNQPDLFGEVAPHATVWRTIERVADHQLGGVDGPARRRAWDEGGGPPLVDGC